MSISLIEPFNNCVYQRNNDGIATIPVIGTASGATSVTATLTRLQVGLVQTLAYALPIVQTLSVDSSGNFAGTVDLPSGWYSLTVSTDSETANISHVGSGEVFLKFGHSYMDGGHDKTHQLPANDERVVTLLDDLTNKNFQFGKLTQNIGPQNGNPDAWGILGDLLVSRLNVPVMFYGCAYGGSNLQMSLEVINNQPLTKTPPGYAGSDSRQPFKPLEYVMDNYVPKTGLRAILFEHGYNDRGTDRATFLQRLKDFFTYVRNRWQKPNLAAIVVQEQLTAVTGSLYDIPTAQAQQDFISTFPNVWKGPDFNTNDWAGLFSNHDHLYGGMIDLFAKQFADSITGTTFLTSSTPYLPTDLPASTLPVLSYATEPVTLTSLDFAILVGAGVCLVALFVYRSKYLVWAFLILALIAMGRLTGKL